ncbi:MAG: hypothetical protein Q8Q31_05030 [Nanoarchaeota archaeon]|nr:hypothetical protein [Nanoarchaeota archaeon]
MTVKKIAKGLAKHFVDSTALLAIPVPLYAAYETLLLGMKDIVSFTSKATIIGLTYAGLGFLVSEGRDLSKRLFGLTQESPERLQKKHDFFYFATINIPLSIGLYIYSGETDWKKIALGTGLSSILGAVMGPVNGYIVDSARDVVHLEECKRTAYVKYFKHINPFLKTSLAPLTVAASIALTAGIYHLSSDKSISEHYKKQSLEQKIEIEQR